MSKPASSTGYFKFLNQEHSAFLTCNPIHIRFGRLSYYRLLEKLTNDRHIGDAGEGELVVELVEHHRPPDPSDVIVLHSARLTYHTDCFVFSAVEGDFNRAALAFMQSGPNAYDAALRIQDMPTLIDLISAGTINGRLLVDMFAITAGPVRYAAKRTLQVTQDIEIEGGDPYLKDAVYSGQQEYRIVLTPREKFHECDFITIELPNAPSPFQVVEGVPSTRESDTPSTPSADKIAVAINDVLNEWREAWSASTLRIHEHYARLRNPHVIFPYREIGFEPFKPRLGQLYWQARWLWPDSDLDWLFLNKSSSPDTMIAAMERYVANLTAPNGA